MNRRTAKHILDELVERSGSTVSVTMRSRFPGGRNVGGKYSLDSHSITMYLSEIRKQAADIFGSQELEEDVLRIVFAHELGHAEDPLLVELSDRLYASEQEQERKRIALRIEENAWDYARALIPEVDPGMVETMIYFSLRAYRESIAEEIA
ncbi:hypothetical protein DCC85_20640 [Paenibacillus sp. CAA11]|uniref:hypothetical protein n=1 Tax=Paenibacillus sp. CAA11 TaxID=1532905 RepID=UPI000D36DDB7|nr:hypothetical protein [Paenibacillus sp. CAA11]AWB46335.1 hypothetical protein DCC85_20640 [Paenibacillus sp. CAA11]